MSRSRRKRNARRRTNFERVLNECMRIAARTFGGRAFLSSDTWPMPDYGIPIYRPSLLSIKVVV